MPDCAAVCLDLFETAILFQNCCVIYIYISSDWKTYFYTKTWTLTFIVALFIIIQDCDQPRCSSIGKWVNKLWYMYRIDFIQ